MIKNEATRPVLSRRAIELKSTKHHFKTKRRVRGQIYDEGRIEKKRHCI